MDKEKKVKILKMRNEDLIDVARVHINAFPKSFLSKLGIGAIRRYYEWQMIGPHNHYNIVAELDGKLVGFCVGGISRGAMIGFLKKYRFYLAIKLLSKLYLLFHKDFFAKFVFAVKLFLKKIFFNEESKAKTRISDSYGILAICVLKEVQGLGVAKELMIESENKAKREGFKYMHLTVDSDNTRAIKFYEKLGFVKVLERSKNGSVFMQKRVDKE